MAEIHGPGGKFHLHGGKLESMTGDADMDRPAAGICSRDLDRFVKNVIKKTMRENNAG